jgi:hypothetical protein
VDVSRINVLKRNVRKVISNGPHKSTGSVLQDINFHFLRRN